MTLLSLNWFLLKNLKINISLIIFGLLREGLILQPWLERNSLSYAGLRFRIVLLHLPTGIVGVDTTKILKRIYF